MDTTAIPARDVPIDQLTDLTSRAKVTVTLESRDSFANEVRYDVSVKNQSAEPFDADSLILVLDEVTDRAGKDAFERIEAVGEDGKMADGKPYFKIPSGKNRELPPYRESKPSTIRLRNPAYAAFTPTFRVLGLLHASTSVTDLIHLLIKKGIITEEEWRDFIGTKQMPDQEDSGANLH